LKYNQSEILLVTSNYVEQSSSYSWHT